MATRNGSEARERNAAAWRQFADSARPRPEAVKKKGKRGVWIPENVIRDALDLKSEDQCRDALGAIVIDGYTEGYSPTIKSAAARKAFDSGRRQLESIRESHNQGVENGKKGGNPVLIQTTKQQEPDPFGTGTGPKPDPFGTGTGPKPDPNRTERGAATSRDSERGVNPIPYQTNHTNPSPLSLRTDSADEPAQGWGGRLFEFRGGTPGKVCEFADGLAGMCLDAPSLFAGRDEQRSAEAAAAFVSDETFVNRLLVQDIGAEDHPDKPSRPKTIRQIIEHPREFTALHFAESPEAWAHQFRGGECRQDAEAVLGYVRAGHCNGRPVFFSWGDPSPSTRPAGPASPAVIEF